jgi:ATP-dependent DNA ligase
MADQLSLHLEATTPRLPPAIRPMMAQTALEPFDSPDHLFEPNWGGTRVLAFIEPNAEPNRAQFRLLDERGRDVAPLLPELGTLPNRVSAESVVMDGEVVVVDRLGRGDKLALAARLRGRPGPSVAFLAFDVLYRDGRPLFNTPLERRREVLRRLLRPGEEAIAVPSIVGEGRALYTAIVEAGIAGVMARVRRSPYLPGVKSRLWRFVPRREADDGSPHEIESTPTDALEPADVDMAPRTAPMFALIRRLPLDDPEP